MVRAWHNEMVQGDDGDDEMDDGDDDQAQQAHNRHNRHNKHTEDTSIAQAQQAQQEEEEEDGEEKGEGREEDGGIGGGGGGGGQCSDDLRMYFPNAEVQRNIAQRCATHPNNTVRNTADAMLIRISAGSVLLPGSPLLAGSLQGTSTTAVAGGLALCFSGSSGGHCP